MTEATGIVGDYFRLREEAGADVLAMQLGDFYEFFGDDAELVNEELDLKLSEKSSGGESYPMAGVPVDDLVPYLRALVERGYRVAVADQHDDGDDIVRELERVVTPGTLGDPTDADARYLAAVVAGDGEGGADEPVGLAFADVTTGRFRATTAPDAEAALAELYRVDPVEVLAGPDARGDDGLLAAVRDRLDATPTLHEAAAFDPGRARHGLREQFGEGVLDAVGLADPAARAAGAVVDYLAATDDAALAAVTRLRTDDAADEVTLDATTQRNLELLETMRGDGEGSLLSVLDHTRTAAGGRLLREWLTAPTRDRAELARRGDAVEALVGATLAREELRDLLGEAYDLERLASRATAGRADPRDLLQLRDTLGLVPDLRGAAESHPGLADSPVAALLAPPESEDSSSGGTSVAALRETLDAALAADPPASPEEGGLIRRGYDDDLDELVARHDELREWFDGLADRIRREHGLTHVTVDRNSTDGWYVQVGKSEADDAPAHFEAVKTLKNSERFTFDELAERERELLGVEERRAERERTLFADLVERAAAVAGDLQALGRAVAEVDVLASLATHAVDADWTRPELTDADVLDVAAGRHPVVERTTEFVPNDARLDDDERFVVVTGPNMSGKSTYLRQTALIVLLAQVGSFVPADSARIGLVDGIFTRVGALDELAGGRSTFMVEMQELSNILHSATADSLVILDEVGRGTATYDGISIAWAATEYLHNEVRAKTLFATHYHELTALSEHLDRVANAHVAVDDEGDDVTFLRRVDRGPTDRSYGVHVADLAGVPDPVVGRAREVLDRLRAEEAVEARGAGDGGETRQVVFDVGSGEYRPADEEGVEKGDGDGARANGGGTGGDGRDPAAEAVLDALADLDVDETPPVELMARVREWQSTLEDE
jgi:DNA mismatch repair protein MutS